MSTTEPAATPPEFVYGAKAIGAVINEPNTRVVYHRLEIGYIPGAWKAGKTWALTVSAFRRAAGAEAA